MKTKTLFFFFCWGIIFSSGIPSLSWGSSLYSRYREGESLYCKKKYGQALNRFIDAQIESPEDARLKYNIANTHYKMKNYEEAVKSYLDVASTARDISLEEKVYFNLGNCFYKQGKLPEAVTYYKKALELDPNDQDAKYNLEFVREEIKRRINEAKKRQEKQQNKKPAPDQSQRQQEIGEKDNYERKDQKPLKKQKDQMKAGSQENKKGKKRKGKKGGGNPVCRGGETKSAQSRKMSPEEAERWLRSLNEDQREVLKSQLRNQFKGTYSPEKDW